jgi:serine/threonine protein kinase
MSVPPKQLFPDLNLSKFVLKATLGTGSFGRVRLVQYKENNDFYALKMLKKSEVIYLKQVDHIKTEKKILEEIGHPNIVNMFGSFMDDKFLYLLMEYVIGGEFFTHLRKAGRFPNDTAKYYAAQVSLAFEYLHSLTILYRDLKPENLLLDADGHCKVTDFGFAKKVEYRTWTLCGTPEYLAPEIILSKGHGKSVDWWATGILCYEMLAGYPPFYDEDPLGIYQKILEGKIKFPWHFDRHSKDLIKKLLTADLTKRLGTLKGGAEDVKRHKWFSDIDWEKLLARSVEPPIKPECKSKDDTSNFDSYPESAEGSAQAIDPRDQALFTDF